MESGSPAFLPSRCSGPPSISELIFVGGNTFSLIFLTRSLRYCLQPDCVCIFIDQSAAENTRRRRGCCSVGETFCRFGVLLTTKHKNSSFLSKNNRIYVCKDSKRLNVYPRCTAPTTKHGGGGVMVWGDVCSSFQARLTRTYQRRDRRRPLLAGWRTFTGIRVPTKKVGPCFSAFLLLSSRLSERSLRAFTPFR